MFQIDTTKNQLSRVIQNDQLQFNDVSHQFQKRNRGNFISSRKKQRRASNEQRKQFKKSLADIQRNQIELRNVDQANDLIRERLQDEQNLIQWGQKFPYGKENVNISEDVLERYRGNFDEQARVLQKFRKQAELHRKTAKAKNRKSKWQTNLRNYQTESYRKDHDEIEKMRRTLRQQVEKNEVERKMEQKRLKNISELLGSLSTQLHNNSYILDKGIRDLTTKLKDRMNKSVQVRPSKPVYKDIIDLMQASKKIPIVTYCDQPYDARLYFSDIYKQSQKIRREKQQSPCLQNQGQEEYKKILNILGQNNRRLAYLNKYSKLDSSLLSYQ